MCQVLLCDARESSRVREYKEGVRQRHSDTKLRHYCAYVCIGVQSDKNVPPSAVAKQRLEYWSRRAPSPTYVTFEPCKNTILYRNISLTPLFAEKEGVIIRGNERGANGSVKYGMLLATFPCRAKSHLSLLEVYTEKG
jgi:hypothetical protein